MLSLNSNLLFLFNNTDKIIGHKDIFPPVLPQRKSGRDPCRVPKKKKVEKVVFESLSRQIKIYLADLLQNGLSVQGIRVSRFLVQCSFSFAKLSSQS
jgi:hypothetical protein